MIRHNASPFLSVICDISGLYNTVVKKRELIIEEVHIKSPHKMYPVYLCRQNRLELQHSSQSLLLPASYYEVEFWDMQSVELFCAYKITTHLQL